MSLSLYILAFTIHAGNCRLFVVDLNWFGFADAYAQVPTNLCLLHRDTWRARDMYPQNSAAGSSQPKTAWMKSIELRLDIID